jgi:GAF domain-containing protein
VVINDKATTAAYTGALALQLDETQYGRGYGPCLEAAVGEELREITDARTETRWPAHVQHGSLSSLSVPVPVHQTLHAALNLYAVQAHAFGPETADVAREFASYAAVAVGNMHLYETTRQRAENLEIAMQNRAVIKQAQGILIAQRRCDAAQAFKHPRRDLPTHQPETPGDRRRDSHRRRGTAQVMRPTGRSASPRIPIPSLRGTS